jgi:hypothetical protein
MSKVEAEWRRAGVYWPGVGHIAELAHLRVPGQVKLFTPLLLFSSFPSSYLTVFIFLDPLSIILFLISSSVVDPVFLAWTDPGQSFLT